jgi:amino acid adenylation domain-containing protein/thioester reductase-like protein
MQNIALEGFRLSPQQKHFWSLQPNSSAYRAQCAILLEGKLQVEILKEAVQQVVKRHEILRTKFQLRPGIAIPAQVICDRSNPDWQTFNLSDLTFQQQQAKIEELFQAHRSLTFDWERDSLLRLSLLILSPGQHIFLITLPSLCADSWTLKNLVREIAHTYEKCLNNEQLSDEPVQYIQFSEWQNELLEEEDAETGKTYWQQQLDSLTAITLPFEQQPSDKRFDPDVWSLKIDPAVVAKLEYTADLHNTTIREFLLSCWQILLWRITGQSEIAIETVFSGRTYEELHETLGLLAKWLPVCCPVRSHFKFREILSGISQTLQDRDQWQEYFIWEENTGSNDKIAFEFEDWSDKYDAGGVSFSVDRQYVCFERFKVKLSCIRGAESLTAKFHYDPEIIDPQSIQYWGELFQTLVANAVNNPEARVGELEILSDRDRQRILFEFNQTQSAYPLDKCIHQLFTEQAAETPDKIALVFEDQQLTYAQLNARANKIAHYLQNLGVKPEVLVGIYLERSPLIIISLLAILKAGGAYLPLDPALPSSALTLRLQDAEAKVLLTQQQLIENLPELATKILCLDSDQEIVARESEENPHCEVKTENLVYTIYTSGSTGKPKGVAIEHRQLLNYFYFIQSKLNLTPGSSFALVSTFAADLGNTVIFPSLCSGGCLHIISSERTSDPQAVADYFDHHPIDCLKIVPSHLKALLTIEDPGKILPRQRLILGGEATSWDLIDRVRQIAPECKIINHYGPTEATIGVTTFEVEKGAKSNKSATVPIGRAIANTQIYLLDSQKQPVPIGVSGELYIGGVPLARGYLNQPELTAQKFITNPFVEGRIYNTGDKARYLPDGNIEFLGRTDNQVKIRGFRIELGEIEVVLSQHPEVEQVVVAVSEDESGNRKLIAYVVPRSQTPSISDLRIFSLCKLPEYATPSAFILLKTLPLTPNGKIDRQALPAPDSTRPELEAVYAAPRTSIEEKLVEIWQELLGLEKIGIQDNFFELGGHSLLITQLLARVRDTFKVEISLHSLFKLPTIANIAQKIQGTKPGTKDTPINLKAEAVLDSTIRPNGLTYNPDVTPTAILLTGATGFLGAFLLYELLEQTQADVYCLVRSANIESGKKRLQNSLESYLLWNESFSARIIPVIGDLSEPLLGLSEQEFQLMATQLDVIYHNGALVNFTYPYQTLKKPNVLGTQEILRLASQVKLKPVHFISTTSFIYPSDSEIRLVREQDSIDDVLMPTDGYAQSKWVAEKLVTIARDRGLPISIYRPGRISGHSKTGACNSNDHTYRIIKGCIQLGSMPNLDIQLNLSPCDYVSRAIVYLSEQSESLGKTFHLCNPQPLSLREMAKYICSLGYPVELVSYDQWRSQLVNHPDASANALYPLISTFVAGNVNHSNSNSNGQASPPIQKYDCQNTMTGLANSAIACPPVDAEVFGIYISYLRQTSVLNPPSLQTQTHL